MKLYQYIGFTIIMTGCNCTLLAQSENSLNVITTAVPSLRIPSEARSGGMGATGVATTPDVDAVYWNPGKLPFVEAKGSVYLNYSPWLREWVGDMYKTFAAGFYKLNENESISGSVSYFKAGDLRFVDNKGNYLQSYHPSEYTVEAGYSRKLSARVGLGLGLKYIRSNLARGSQNGVDFKPGNAIAADLGLYYDLRKENKEGWSFGAALSNLGSRISYTSNSNQKGFLPANLGIGASYTNVFNDQNKLNIALDINKLLVPAAPDSHDSVGLAAYQNKSVVGSFFSSFSDASGGFSEELKEVQVSMGLEYWYNDQIAFRAGYFYEDKTKGNRKFFSAGIGIKYNVFTVNFSYLVPSGQGINRSPLANTLQFGAAVNINN